jgi:hypothetical protein
MVIQNDIGIELQAFMLAAKQEGVEENVKIRLSGEERNPFDYREGDEVQTAWLSNGIAASHGSRGDTEAKLELRRKRAFPSWSLGTRGFNERL